MTEENRIDDSNLYKFQGKRGHYGIVLYVLHVLSKYKRNFIDVR